MPELFNGTVVTEIEGLDRIGLNTPGTAGSKNITWNAFKTLLTSLYVGLTGNQTIAGTKSFTSPPIVPNPTAATHAVNLQTLLASGIVRSVSGVTIANGSNPIDLGQSAYAPVGLVSIIDSDGWDIKGSFGQWKYGQTTNYTIEINNGGSEITNVTLYYLT